MCSQTCKFQLAPSPLLHHVRSVLKSALKGSFREASTQTDATFFQQCDCCNIIFALDGNESLAGACGICQRKICYLCSVALAWDESITELMNICENCREESEIAAFTRKFDIHEICERVALPT